MKNQPFLDPSRQEDQLVDEQVRPEHQLILFNDEFNTFDWVIESLIAICQHERTQAEQCSLIVHYNGKCSVKHGEMKDLRPMCEALLERGLSAVIE